jgi:MYXO-CTERM domain-containing protein
VALSSLVWSAESDAGAIDQNGLFTAGVTNGDWPSAVKAKMGSISASAGVRISDGTTGVNPIDLGDEGCSCSLSAGDERSAGVLLPLLLVLGLVLRRRWR